MEIKFWTTLSFPIYIWWEISKNVNIAHEFKESRNAYRLMQTSEIDNNGQTNSNKYEHSTGMACMMKM
jgi:hypothetical protein